MSKSLFGVGGVNSKSAVLIVQKIVLNRFRKKKIWGYFSFIIKIASAQGGRKLRNQLYG
jgi:hypothetical protein